MLNNVNDVAFHSMMAEYHYNRWNYYINLTRTILSDNEDDEIFVENRFLQNQAEYHDNKSSQFDELKKWLTTPEIVLSSAHEQQGKQHEDAQDWHRG